MSKSGFPFNAGIIIGLAGGLIGGLVGVIAAFMAHWIIGLIVLAIMFFVFRMIWRMIFQPALRNKRLMETGIEAEATIISISETGSSLQIGGALPKAGVELILEVNATDRPAYKAAVRTFVTVFEIQKFQPGSKIKIKYDAKKPQLIAIVEGHAFSNFQSGLEVNKEEAQKLLEELTKTQQDLFSRGVEEKGIIKSSHETGVLVNGDNPLVEMEVEVAPGTSASMFTKLYAVVMRASLYKSAPGKEITVKTDPDNRKRLTLFHLTDAVMVSGDSTLPSDQIHHNTPADFIQHYKPNKKRGCSLIFFIILGVGLLIGLWFLLRDEIMPNRIKGEYKDAILVPGDNGNPVLFLITDGSFYYTSETNTPGEHSIKTKSLFDKMYIYKYDPGNEKVLYKKKLSFDDTPSFVKLKYINERIWLIMDSYSNHNPEIQIFDPVTCEEISSTEAFVNGFPQLSSGIAELNIYNPELRFSIRCLDHSSMDAKIKPECLMIKTKDGLQFDYYFDVDSLYKNNVEYEKHWLKFDSSRTHWFIMDDMKAPRKDMVIVEGKAGDFDAEKCKLKDTVEKYSDYKYYNIIKNYTSAQKFAIQGLKLITPETSNIFLEGFMIYADNDYCVVVHQDQVGDQAKRLITCINASGKKCWTLTQDDFFEELAIDPDDAFSSAFFIESSVTGLRLGNTFALKFNDVGIAGYDMESGKKLWEFVD
jgi:hypothetical protein